MAFKLMKWYALLVWNFYAIGTKVLLWLMLKGANRIWTLIT
jgi:hypothetical protein